LGAVTKRRVLPLLLGLLAFVLAGATVPHLHTATGPGLWNYDHDMSLMAAGGTHAGQSETMPDLGLDPDIAVIVTAPAEDHPGAPLRPSAPRAPPRS
jgi:hypothetical protein